MRTVDVATLTQNIKEMCIEANHFLSEDMKTAFTKAEQQEKAPFRIPEWRLYFWKWVRMCI